MKIKLKVDGDKVTIKKGSDSLLSKLISASKGKVKIKTPFGEREIRVVKNYTGRVIRREE